MYIDRETIIHLGATLFVLGSIGFIVGMLAWIWHNRPRKAHEQLQVRISCSIDEFDAEIARLRCLIDAYMPYDVRVEAEMVLEQYQASLETREEIDE
jgi:hypothetical protein